MQDDITENVSLIAMSALLSDHVRLCILITYSVTNCYPTGFFKLRFFASIRYVLI